MKTNTSSLLPYPNQPIHPALVAKLYQRAEWLEARARRESHLRLPDDLASRMVAMTLRRMDRKGECLYPRNADRLATLLQKALGYLHYAWNETSSRDYGRQARKAVLESLDAQEGEAWQPAASLYGSGSSLCPEEGCFPGEDLLAGESGRAVLQILTGEFELTEERAVAVLLDCILPDFPAVAEVLREMGFQDFSPTYMRKWIGKRAPEFRKRLQKSLETWGLGEGAPKRIAKNLGEMSRSEQREGLYSEEPGNSRRRGIRRKEDRP